jgi:rare lipoprotein A
MKFAFINITIATLFSACLDGVAHAAPSRSGQVGLASIYSGGRTESGERAVASRTAAAHRSLPFGTMVLVTNRDTGRSVVVRIIDRGPFVRGRVIDVTPAAAHRLGFSTLAPVFALGSGTWLKDSNLPCPSDRLRDILAFSRAGTIGVTSDQSRVCGI